jgi:hypothetical protein
MKTAQHRQQFQGRKERMWSAASSRSLGHSLNLKEQLERRVVIEKIHSKHRQGTPNKISIALI